jgi:hypothetical protein
VVDGRCVILHVRTIRATFADFINPLQELVQAIQANSGIFRNPLSKEMFTPKDVKGILLHPTGRSLAALRVEQHKMSKGVRTDTIIRMEKLSAVLLEDQSSDNLPSRKAVDEFLLYIATRKSSLKTMALYQLTS